MFCYVSNNCIVNIMRKMDVIFFFKVIFVGQELKEIGNERYFDGLCYGKDGGNFFFFVKNIFDLYSN